MASLQDLLRQYVAQQPARMQQFGTQFPQMAANSGNSLAGLLQGRQLTAPDPLQSLIDSGYIQYGADTNYTDGGEGNTSSTEKNLLSIGGIPIEQMLHRQAADQKSPDGEVHGTEEVFNPQLNKYEPAYVFPGTRTLIPESLAKQIPGAERPWNRPKDVTDNISLAQALAIMATAGAGGAAMAGANGAGAAGGAAGAGAAGAAEGAAAGFVPEMAGGAGLFGGEAAGGLGMDWAGLSQGLEGAASNFAPASAGFQAGGSAFGAGGLESILGSTDFSGLSQGLEGAASNYAPASAGFQAGGSAFGAAGAGGAAAKGAPSALSKILDGTATASDYLELAGKALPGLLGAYGANQQANSLNDLVDKYLELGAPSRGRYEASMTPGFDPMSIPGYKGALENASEAVMRKTSANGNPYGNPGALIEANKTILNGTALPAIQDYQNKNSTSGGYSALNAALPDIARQAIGSGSGVYSALGSAANNVFNPPQTPAQNPQTPPAQSLADLLKLFSNSGIKFSLT